MKPAYSLIIVAIMLIAAGILVMMGDPKQKADLSSVMELVGDAQRTATKPMMMATKISDKEEQALGKELAERMYFGSGKGEADLELMREYVQRLGTSLLSGINRPEIEYTFHVIDHDVVNAFAMPGGQIFVFSGLLKFLESEAELAYILGHEIVHVDARHCIESFQAEMAAKKIAGPLIGSWLVERASQFATMVITGGYRKFQEFQADTDGLRLSIAAGYDPSAGESAMRRLGERFGVRDSGKKAKDPLAELGKSVIVAAGSYYTSHPPANERVEKLKAVRLNLQEKDKKYYRGRENLKQRKTRATLPIETELVSPSE